MKKVVLIGAGNLGVNLYRAFLNCQNIEVVQWYNRSLDNLTKYRDKIDITNNLNKLVQADLYLLCLADTVISEVSKNLNPGSATIAHTAGSVPLKVMETHQNHGVFYPLQTFSKKKKIDFSKIPICIEASNSNTLEELSMFASSLKSPIHYIDSTQRKTLHLAAVFVNNFSNHLFTIGEELCNKNQLPFSILVPLMEETVAKIKSLSPKQAQTGPAFRNDQITINNHLSQLEEKKHKKLYLAFTEAIQKTYGK